MSIDFKINPNMVSKLITNLGNCFYSGRFFLFDRRFLYFIYVF